MAENFDLVKNWEQLEQSLRAQRVFEICFNCKDHFHPNYKTKKCTVCQHYYCVKCVLAECIGSYCKGRLISLDKQSFLNILPNDSKWMNFKENEINYSQTRYNNKLMLTVVEKTYTEPIIASKESSEELKLELDGMNDRVRKLGVQVTKLQGELARKKSSGQEGNLIQENCALNNKLREMEGGMLELTKENKELKGEMEKLRDELKLIKNFVMLSPEEPKENVNGNSDPTRMMESVEERNTERGFSEFDVIESIVKSLQANQEQIKEEFKIVKGIHVEACNGLEEKLDQIEGKIDGFVTEVKGDLDGKRAQLIATLKKNILQLQEEQTKSLSQIRNLQQQNFQRSNVLQSRLHQVKRKFDDTVQLKTSLSSRFNDSMDVRVLYFSNFKFYYKIFLNCSNFFRSRMMMFLELVPRIIHHSLQVSKSFLLQPWILFQRTKRSIT